jgi:predicted nucleic acid-binding protein
VTLVDTTVWIDFLRGIQSPEKRKLDELIRGPELVAVTDIIVTEILRGVVEDPDFDATKRHLSAFPCLTARAPKTFNHAAELYRLCRKKGATVRSTVDCLFAAVCIENDATLLHHDVDFEPLRQHCGLKVILP